ncbi:MAG: DUF4177 domain-containing protein [Acidimicrobiales bacterium]|nr:DUF4177 domain-containing protein [Acidimicrobiales bacterium]
MQYKVVVHETKKLLKDDAVVDEMSKTLNGLGAEGWELVSVAPFSSTQGLDLGGSTKAHTFVFKRPA